VKQAKTIVVITGDSLQTERIRSMLSELDEEWSPLFVADVEEALAKLKGGIAADAMLAETEYWERSDGTLLGELKHKFPSVAPVSLSLPPPGVLDSPRLPATALLSATDLGSLGIALERTRELQSVLSSDVARRLIDEIDQLPYLPGSYHALMQAASRPTSSVSEFVEIIQADPALSVRLLQLVNSSFFGSKSRVNSVHQAVTQLGLGLLKGLIASAHVFGALDASRSRVVSLERCQLYSLRVARLARALASSPEVGEEAFTAGLLHNIGELVLAVERPEEFTTVVQRCAETRESQVAVERAVFGVTHPEVGARLLVNWGIPFAIVEVAAFHHEPQRAQGTEFEVLATVHTADALAGIITCGDAEDTLDVAFLARAGLLGHLPRWRRLVEQQVATWTAVD
jgi:HD-like signal output (HDOD) protein